MFVLDSCAGVCEYVCLCACVCVCVRACAYDLFTCLRVVVVNPELCMHARAFINQEAQRGGKGDAETRKWILVVLLPVTSIHMCRS